jgi:hypothetical protein
MTLPGAMADMADSMTAVNASRRQVGGVAKWRDLVDAAIAAGLGAGGDGSAPEADVAGSRVHAPWMATAQAIISALDMLAARAAALACYARERAGQAAADARRASAACDAAIAAGDHAAAAVAADQANAALRAAHLADENADACDAWSAAAADAAACGRGLAAGEHEIAVRVGVALAAAGGRRWVAGDKTFFTRDGGA